MRWSENETCQFVHLYLDYESLWNTEHDDYKIKAKRLNAYKNIIKDFHSSTGICLSINELKVKIKNLRSTYTQELSKIKQRSGPDYTYKPTIKWFSYWHKRFKRSNTSEISDSLYEETEKDSTKMWKEEEAENLNEEHLDSYIPENNDDYIFLLKCEPEQTLIKINENSSTYKNKRRKIQHRSLSTASEGTFRGSLDSTLDSSKEDEFDIYGKYIATQLRTMNLKKALRVQLEIQSLVSEARLSELSND